MRAIAFLLSLAAFALAAAPATLLDAALRDASDERLRLAAAHGTLWVGGGRLATHTGNDRLTPWIRVDWRLEPGALLRGALVWHIEADRRPAARVALAASGLTLSAIDAELPVRGLARALPHPLAQAGWDGQLRVTGETLRCVPAGACAGGLQLRVDGLRTAILPGPDLGDYVLGIRAAAGSLESDVASAAGNRLRIDGQLALAADGTPRAALDVTGDAELMRVLPGVLHGVAHAQPDGRLQVRIPAR
jgi:hypothetical protein